MARMVVLQRATAMTWEHLGAVDVDVDVPGDWDMTSLTRAQSLAVEQKAAQGGVFVAIPFEFWRLFEAEAQITVKQVPMAPSGGGLAEDMVEEAGAHEEGNDLGLDPDMEGLTQGPRLP